MTNYRDFDANTQLKFTVYVKRIIYFTKNYEFKGFDSKKKLF